MFVPTGPLKGPDAIKLLFQILISEFAKPAPRLRCSSDPSQMLAQIDLNTFLDVESLIAVQFTSPGDDGAAADLKFSSGGSEVLSGEAARNLYLYLRRGDEPAAGKAADAAAFQNFSKHERHCLKRVILRSPGSTLYTSPVESPKPRLNPDE